MREYEMIIILSPGLEEAGLEEEIEKISGLIENDGTVIEIDRWGKKPLSYEIGKERNGIYVLFRFRSEPSLLPELRAELKLDEKVLRQRIVLSSVGAQASAEESSGAADKGGDEKS